MELMYDWKAFQSIFKTTIIDQRVQSQRALPVLEDIKKLDQWISQVSILNHYFDQIQYLKREVGGATVTSGHFFLNAILGGWSRFFPPRYGLYIQLGGQSGMSQSVFLTVRKTSLESYCIPDFSLLSIERSQSSEEVVKFLSNRYVMPVQGIFVNESEWKEWSEMERPWPRILKTLRRDHSKLVPFRWGLLALIAGRAYLK